MATHESASYRFTVKEGQATAPGNDDAPLSLMLEPMDGDLSFLRSGFMTLRLKPGTSMEEAQELSRRLNRSITSVAFTEL